MQTGEKNKRERRNRLQEIQAFIASYQEAHGRPPTEREMASAVGLKSPSTISGYLKKLVDAGDVTWDKKTSRGYSVPKKPAVQPRDRINLVPCLGYIAAGIPLTIPGQGAEHSAPMFDIEVPESYLPPGVLLQDVFALKVTGDSMRDAMIQDGDTVLIQKTQNLRTGDIVAAWLVEESSTTLKRIRFTENGIWLEPENPASAFKKTLFNPDQIAIQGKVLGILRLYI